MRKSALASVNTWTYLRKKIVEIVDTERVFLIFKSIYNCFFLILESSS